jgi:hypothetical protein
MWGGTTDFDHGGHGQPMNWTAAKAAACLAAAAALIVASDAAGERWFREVTHEAGIHHKHSNRVFDNPYSKIMAGYTAIGAAVAVADFDGDGYDDNFLTDSAADGKNHLHRNNHDFTFTECGAKAGVAGGNDAQNASTDALWLDYNNDGRPDLFVVRYGHSQLFQKLGNGKFREVTKQAGLDRYSNGYQKKRLFHNERGQIFKDEAARHGLDSTLDGRGIAIADFDNDGRLDVLMSNANAEPLLWRNTMPAGPHWVQFLLEGTRSNRAAVGAQLRITVNGQKRLEFVSGGNSFAAQFMARVHFGLGSADSIERMEVRWPSGLVENFPVPAVDRLYKLKEGTGKP